MAYMKDSAGRRLDALVVTSAAKGTKNISGASNVTLTAAECGVALLDLTSATQTITITVPTGCSFQLRNSTDYAQTIKAAGATGTASIEAGSSWKVQS